MSFSFFSSAIYLIFFNDTATTEIYTYGHTLSLHDALPILEDRTSIPCRLIMSRILKSGSPILMWRALASSLRAMAQPSLLDRTMTGTRRNFGSKTRSLLTYKLLTSTIAWVMGARLSLIAEDVCQHDAPYLRLFAGVLLG